MRDTLIHRYDSVDLEEVWDTARRDIPALLTSLEPVLISRGILSAEEESG